ncbi:bombyxin C-1-like [Pectinophora gossypiella]|uniref:bombyxin C-1-like n=1 Tax=Pectinophora gossypiella TaxID=13191 RepID=UPI00214E03B5|nr:bombyxin C-1-like [Pectinophora gossypiella]
MTFTSCLETSETVTSNVPAECNVAAGRQLKCALDFPPKRRHENLVVKISMNLRGSMWLFAFLAVLSLCSAHIGGIQNLQNVKPLQTYCGRKLARYLAVLCYDEDVEKRSETDSGTMYKAILTPYYKDQDAQLGWPWLSPHKARGLGVPTRGKRFIITECCNKACGVEELMTYC